jgi:Glycosyl hydrolase catalytic core
MRRLTPLLVLLIAALAVPAGASAATFGISDQQASTFSNPLFAPLKSKVARYITPYDVMSDPVQRERLDAWVKAATAARQRILVSFEHSRRAGREGRLPSVREYTREITKFKRKYPRIKEISSWNEVNRRYDAARREGQPTWKSPKRVAEYYMAARKVFRGSKIVGLDILDENNPNRSIKFIRSFKRYAKPAPKYYGVHNYSDTNRFSQTRTRRMIAAIGKGAEIWLTETGGIVALGSATNVSFPYDEQRAARALGCMFDIARDQKQVKRLYVYQFHGAAAGASFDAGLVDGAGTATRPGYAVAQQRKARNCR